MPDGRRWRNLGDGDQTVFITTTVQGFTPVFGTPLVADVMTSGLLGTIEELNAAVYGFVVMPEHLHLLIRLPSGMSASRLANIIKSKAARRILPILDENIRRKHESSRTLQDRVLWQTELPQHCHRRGVGLQAKTRIYTQQSGKKGFVCEEQRLPLEQCAIMECWAGKRGRLRSGERRPTIRRWLATPRGGGIAACGRKPIILGVVEGVAVSNAVEETRNDPKLWGSEGKGCSAKCGHLR